MKRKFILILVAMIVAAASAAIAAKRARPPQWSRDVQDTFFEDARTKLEGPRPDYQAASSTQADTPAESNRDSPWSKLVTPTTLETEVKRLAQSLDAATRSPSEFKSTGYKSARRDFSELAALFAVIGQYDGTPRWRDVAAGMRGQFAQAGFAAKAGSDESFRVATERKLDLAALVRGERPSASKAAADFKDWSQVAARPALMQRMNIAHEERLKPWLADADAFRRNRDEIQHEAQIVAMLAEVIHRDAYEYSDDETFVGYARELRDAATDAATAAAADNFEQTRAAVTRATGACTNCHAGYRG